MARHGICIPVGMSVFATVKQYHPIILLNNAEYQDLAYPLQCEAKVQKVLRNKNWSKFALYYNGSGNKKNNYDTVIEGIYESL